MIETSSTFITKLDEDTLKVIFKPNSYLSMEEYESLLDYYRSLLGRDSGIKFLVIIQPGFKMEKQYSHFFKNHYKTNFKRAEAFVLLHPPTRMFFNVGIKLVKPKHPVKLFNKEEDALNWLKKI
ncbi:MAG: hypothetical protein HUJ25_05530 [Crocinitomicaceae bacterium]|nr:hypothetical protein [Crocinitomicaceae bacterium]